MTPQSPTTNMHTSGANVEVWQIALEAPTSLIEQARNCLPEAELNRAKGFREENAQRRHVLAHAALRFLLASKLKCAPREITFQIGPHGKPALPAERHAALHFNLSHSGELALVALCDAAEVGVDIEHIRPVRDPITLAKRFFTPGELSELATSAPADQINCFLRLWTQKEALLKATGQGIANGLQRFEVTGRGGGGLVEMDGDAGAAPGWTLTNWNAHSNPASNARTLGEAERPLTPSLFPSDGERVAERPGQGLADIPHVFKLTRHYVAACAVHLRNATIIQKQFNFAEA